MPSVDHWKSTNAFANAPRITVLFYSQKLAKVFAKCVYRVNNRGRLELATSAITIVTTKRWTYTTTKVSICLHLENEIERYSTINEQILKIKS